MLATKGFTIETEPQRRLLRIAVHGFWNEATVLEYDRGVSAAAQQVMQAAPCAKSDLLVIFDARHATAQSQELLASFKQRFEPADRQPKRIANIVSSALFKRQVERIATPNQRVFEDERSAMEWLLS